MVLSKNANDTIKHLYKELESGEKIMLLGESRFLHGVWMVPLSFVSLTFIVSVFLYSSYPFFLLLPLVIAGICFYIQETNRRWYALTSKRLLRVEKDGTVSTVAARSKIQRIEASSDVVNLTVTGDPNKFAIRQVRGLPEIVGGKILK